MDGVRVDDVAFDEIFQVAVDDRQRGAEFVGGIGDKVFAHLFGEVLGSDVANDDAGDLFGSVFIEGGGVDEPGGFASFFGHAEGGGLLGDDDPFNHFAASGEGLFDHHNEPFVEEDLFDISLENQTARDQLGGGPIGEEDLAFAIDQKKGVAEGVQKLVLLLAESEFLALQGGAHFFLRKAGRFFLLQPKCEENKGDESAADGGKVRHSGNFETVADPANGFHQIGVVPEFVAEALHVGVEGAAVDFVE